MNLITKNRPASEKKTLDSTDQPPNLKLFAFLKNNFFQASGFTFKMAVHDRI